MSIEVSAARFSFGKAVLPPKQEKTFTPPPPGWLFEDAKRCNAGLRGKSISLPEDEGGWGNNMIDPLESEASVMAAMDGATQMVTVIAATGLSRATANRAMLRLEAKGLVRANRSNRRCYIWHRIEIAPQASQDRPEAAISTFRGASTPKHTSAPRGGVGGGT